jgi:mono/diheme cytochrome c family protein
MNSRPAVALFFTATIAMAAAGARAQGTLTASQATAGKAVYSQSCASCHGASLQGSAGPALTGSAFTSAYPSAGKLYDYVRKNMPLGAPGSLSTAQYQQVTAYLLQQNGKLGKK